MKIETTVEYVVDYISNISESGARNDGFLGNAIAADGKRRDTGEVGGSDQGGVTAELHKLPGADQNGSEFQNGIALTGSGRHRRLHIKEGYFGSIVSYHRHFFIFLLV